MKQLKIARSITKRDCLSLEKYLQEISKIQKATPEQEAALAQNIKKGCIHSLHILTNANLRFVVSVAKQYQFQGLDLADLINDGNIGLFKAAQRFDETKGFKFISYAVWWIRQSIIQSLADQSRLVRLPVNKVSFTAKVFKVMAEFEQEFERAPTPEEVATILNADINEVISSLSVNEKHISFLSPAGDEEGLCLLDVIENKNADRVDESKEKMESLHIDLNRTLSALTPRQKEVICFFYGIGMDHALTLEEIGNRYNLTRERVRQIRDKGIMKLKHLSKYGWLKTHLG
jgi:RNA polymerase primary sigma factor